MSEMDDFNTRIIEEFRANDGVVGGPFEGATLVLLHTTGAKSGAERVTPVVARLDGDDLYVFASKAGAPTHPDWFHNLVADPSVTVELGTDTFAATAVVLEGERGTRSTPPRPPCSRTSPSTRRRPTGSSRWSASTAAEIVDHRPRSPTLAIAGRTVAT